jgi:hypothetical protein
MSEESNELAWIAANRLHAAATTLLTLTSILAALALAGGVAMAFVNQGSTRWIGVGVSGGAVIWWLLTILPFLGAQAVARYIEFRTDQA